MLEKPAAKPARDLVSGQLGRRTRHHKRHALSLRDSLTESFPIVRLLDLIEE